MKDLVLMAVGNGLWSDVEHGHGALYAYNSKGILVHIQDEEVIR